MNNDLNFTGKTVLVIGAAGGIGAAIARRFAARGAVPILVDRDGEAVGALAAELAGRAHTLDLADADAIQTLVGTLPRLDILVHNAAYFPLTALDEITPALLRRTLAVNLEALFWLTRAARPLLKGGGNILVTSSVTGNRVAYPGLSHYAASKAGVNGFIRNAALELAGEGIRVNGVEPGMIRTPAMANLGDGDLSDAIAHSVPLGHLGDPLDIANAMLFLASDLAGYITGQTLIVDGGALLPETGAAGG